MTLIMVYSGAQNDQEIGPLTPDSTHLWLYLKLTCKLGRMWNKQVENIWENNQRLEFWPI